MRADTKLLMKIVALVVIIFTIALNYKEVKYDYTYSRMTKAQKIHELHKLGIPTEEESKMEMSYESR